MPALGTSKQEDQVFKTSFSYIVCLWPAWDTWVPALKTKQKYKIPNQTVNGGEGKSSEKQRNSAKDFTNVSWFQEGQSKS